MATDSVQNRGGRLAAWDRWSDPRLPLRLATNGDLRGDAPPGRLAGWVDWLVVDGDQPADGASLDGVVLRAPFGTEHARALAKGCPELPLLDERAPRTAGTRAAFLERVFALNRWRVRARVNRPLAEFHEAHDLLLRVRGEEGAAELAQLARSPDAPQAVYGHAFRRHLARPTDPESVLRILRRTLAVLRPQLAPRDRRALRLAVEEFGRGRLPLLAPRSLLRHYAERGGHERLAGQLFLDPYPADLEPAAPPGSDERTRVSRGGSRRRAAGG